MAATLGSNPSSQNNGAIMPLCGDNVTIANDHTKENEFDSDCSLSNDNVDRMEASQNRCELFRYCQSEFYKERKVLIKNIPLQSTSKDIEDFLGDHEVENIEFEDEQGSTQQAVVVLKHGEEAEEVVSSLDNRCLLDAQVSVCLCGGEPLLCVANLPLHYSEAEFLSLISELGPTRRAFLMRTQQTGTSKGYGFVEYSVSRERVQQIIGELEGRQLGGGTGGGARLQLEEVDENQRSWQHLQSRCLLLSNLPRHFTDLSRLRNIFSCVTSPVYCQIAIKDGKSLGYGIIEFREASDAETTWERLQGEKLEGKELELSFCVPGRPAVLIYNTIMWTRDKKLEVGTKSSLLPDPLFVNPALLSSPLVKALTNQFPKLIPTFMKSLHQLHQTYINSVMSRNTKPGLLGPAPYPPLSPIMNPNMQLGLIIFIALQMQTHQPSLLHPQFTGPLARQLDLLVKHSAQIQKGTVSLKPNLGEPLTARANMLLQNLHVQLQQESTDPSTSSPGPGDGELAPPADQQAALFYQQHLQNVGNLNLNLLISLGQVIFSMQNQQSSPTDQPSPPLPPAPPQPPHVKEGLLPNPRGPSIRNRPKPLLESLDGFIKNLPNTGPQALCKLPGANIQQLVGAGHRGEAQVKTSLLGEPPVRNASGLCKEASLMNCVPGGYRPPLPLFKQPISSEPGDHWGGGANCDDSGYGESSEFVQQKHIQELTSPRYPLNSNNSISTSLVNSFSNFKSLSSSSSDPGSMSYTGAGLLPTPIGASTAYQPANHSKPILSTPVGQKRGYSSLLPEPEPSPEGDYIIGQHSQGIGGHYAETYRKRQKLHHRY